MTGWQIIGVCLAASPFVVMAGFMLADDPEGCFFAWGLTALILGVVTFGVMLATGEWSP